MFLCFCKWPLKMQFTILFGHFHIKTQKLNAYYSSGLREVDSCYIVLSLSLSVNVYVGVVPLATGKLEFRIKF